MDPLPKPPPVSADALAAFRDAAPEIAEEAVRQALSYPENVAHHGEEAPQLMAEGLRYLSNGLDTALAFHTTSLLADQLRWSKDRLPHHGVEPEHILHNLHLYRTAVAGQLAPDHAAEVNAYVDWMIAFQRRLMDDDA